MSEIMDSSKYDQIKEDISKTYELGIMFFSKLKNKDKILYKNLINNIYHLMFEEYGLKNIDQKFKYLQKNLLNFENKINISLTIRYQENLAHMIGYYLLSWAGRNLQKNKRHKDIIDDCESISDAILNKNIAIVKDIKKFSKNVLNYSKHNYNNLKKEYKSYLDIIIKDYELSIYDNLNKNKELNMNKEKKIKKKSQFLSLGSTKEIFGFDEYHNDLFKIIPQQISWQTLHENGIFGTKSLLDSFFEYNLEKKGITQFEKLLFLRRFNKLKTPIEKLYKDYFDQIKNSYIKHFVNYYKSYNNETKNYQNNLKQENLDKKNCMDLDNIILLNFINTYKNNTSFDNKKTNNVNFIDYIEFISNLYDLFGDEIIKTFGDKCIFSEDLYKVNNNFIIRNKKDIEHLEGINHINKTFKFFYTKYLSEHEYEKNNLMNLLDSILLQIDIGEYNYSKSDNENYIMMSIPNNTIKVLNNIFFVKLGVNLNDELNIFLYTVKDECLYPQLQINFFNNEHKIICQISEPSLNKALKTYINKINNKFCKEKFNSEYNNIETDYLLFALYKIFSVPLIDGKPKELSIAKHIINKNNIEFNLKDKGDKIPFIFPEKKGFDGDENYGNYDFLLNIGDYKGSKKIKGLESSGNTYLHNINKFENIFNESVFSNSTKEGNKFYYNLLSSNKSDFLNILFDSKLLGNVSELQIKNINNYNGDEYRKKIETLIENSDWDNIIKGIEKEFVFRKLAEQLNNVCENNRSITYITNIGNFIKYNFFRIKSLLEDPKYSSLTKEILQKFNEKYYYPSVLVNMEKEKFDSLYKNQELIVNRIKDYINTYHKEGKIGSAISIPLDHITKDLEDLDGFMLNRLNFESQNHNKFMIVNKRDKLQIYPLFSSEKPTILKLISQFDYKLKKRKISKDILINKIYKSGLPIKFIKQYGTDDYNKERTIKDIITGLTSSIAVYLFYMDRLDNSVLDLDLDKTLNEKKLNVKSVVNNRIGGDDILFNIFYTPNSKFDSKKYHNNNYLSKNGIKILVCFDHNPYIFKYLYSKLSKEKKEQIKSLFSQIYKLFESGKLRLPQSVSENNFIRKYYAIRNNLGMEISKELEKKYFEIKNGCFDDKNLYDKLVPEKLSVKFINNFVDSWESNIHFISILHQLKFDKSFKLTDKSKGIVLQFFNHLYQKGELHYLISWMILNNVLNHVVSAEMFSLFINNLESLAYINIGYSSADNRNQKSAYLKIYNSYLYKIYHKLGIFSYIYDKTGSDLDFIFLEYLKTNSPKLFDNLNNFTKSYCKLVNYFKSNDIEREHKYIKSIK